MKPLMIRPPLMLSSIAISSATRRGSGRNAMPFPSIATVAVCVLLTRFEAMMFGDGIIEYVV
jgi:hypothetical protein